MAATISVEITVILQKEDCCTACCNLVLNANNGQAGPSKKVLELSHSADCDLTVTETSKSGSTVATFTLRPGQVHRLEFDEKTPLQNLTQLTSSWKYEFSDGRKYKVDKRTTRIHEGDEAVRKN